MSGTVTLPGSATPGPRCPTAGGPVPQQAVEHPRLGRDRAARDLVRLEHLVSLLGVVMQLQAGHGPQPEARGSVSAQESSSQPTVQRQSARKQHKSQLESLSKPDAMEHKAHESLKEIGGLEHVRERNPTL